MSLAPKKYQLSVRPRGQKSGGDVANMVRDENGLANSEARHILLLTHGYNNSYDDAEKSFNAFIENILPRIRRPGVGPDAIAKFQWPGDVSTMFGTTVGYPFDIKNARSAATRLANYIVALPKRPLQITFVGHSMGCRLILEALTKLRSASTPNIEVVGLMAAAVPVEMARRSKRLFATGNPPRKILKFHSTADSVLQFAFPLGQWLAFQYEIEDDNYTEAIGRHGNPDEYGSRSPRPNNKHGDYWGDARVVEIVMSQLERNIRPTPQPEPIGARALPPETQVASRDLLSRTAPFENA